MDVYSLLSTLSGDVNAQLVQQGSNCKLSSITADSRKVVSGSLFVAITGSKSDGHLFLDAAAQGGAACLVVENLPIELPANCTVVQVTDSHKALGLLAAALYDYPAENLQMLAITGTNGKTTVSWMIEQMLYKKSCRVGVIGTINYRYTTQNGREIVVPAPLTTPDAVVLQKLLREMADQGVSHVVMETSSHALEQKRLQGVLFDIAIFTNLSRDHLDYHGSMEAYYAAKKILFTDYLKPGGQAVIVTDAGEQKSVWGERLAAQLAELSEKKQVITCGLETGNTLTIKDLVLDIHGFSGTLVIDDNKSFVTTTLTGRYNVLNLLAAAGAGKAFGLNLSQISSGLTGLDQVPGRLERVFLPGISEEKQSALFVDYAHTPDALHNVLQTLKNLANGRLICVFGCGGDRDRGKRPLMGKVAGELADVVIVTSDNPRSEDPGVIIEEIIPGLEQAGCRKVDLVSLKESAEKNLFTCLPERAQAIALAVSLAKPADIIVVAGKGHEDYQLAQGRKIFFDDRLCALDALFAWNQKHLLHATGGRIGCEGKQTLFGKVSTDTRSLEPGDIFVALAGENFDGHDYVQAAVKSGAAAVIVHKALAKPVKNVLVIEVADTLQALGDLAAYRRNLLRGRVQVLALTGSSGKTTVKEMLAVICRRHLGSKQGQPDPLLKTVGNFNNLVGLPLSLLPLNASHKMVILEMGMNQPGEIARLCAIADPDISCINNVQAAHLEGLGSIEGVAQAKGELFAGIREGSAGVVNLDNPHVRRLPCKASTITGFAVTAAGRRHDPQVKATRLANLGEHGMRFTLHILDWKQRITLPVPGEHNASNAVAAAALAHTAGIPPETIVAGLEAFESVDKRMQYMTLPGGVKVVNDCYNANPASMAAALATMATFGTGNKKIALLGDMLELGSESIAAHATLGRQVARQQYDLLLVKGAFAATVAEGALDLGMDADRVKIFNETLEIVDWLYHAMVEGRITEGDWLLVKGSRGMRMETVLQGLEQRFATGVERG